MASIDDDLRSLTRDELVVEAQRLRDGIRRHRDSTGQELCWHHPQLWGLLPDASDPLPEVPEWSQFLRGCPATANPSTVNFRRLRIDTEYDAG
jgi:hypothetical protein